jgi:thiamine biosynthesis lipoprotein
MGTMFLIQIEDNIPDAGLSRFCDGAMDVLRDADEIFSLYKPGSEISRLNAGTSSWDSASSVQRKIRADALDWKTVTQGFFDPVSPEGSYDPSGLVKSWAARNAAQYLEANGVREFTLNAGGDIHLSHDLTSPLLNKVGLSNLRSIADAAAGSNMVLDLAGSELRAVATSGRSERGEHIWLTDHSSDYIQATVVAKDLVLADIWATALISGGAAALKLFSETVDSADAVALVTTKDLGFTASKGFASVLATV